MSEVTIWVMLIWLVFSFFDLKTALGLLPIFLVFMGVMWIANVL